MRENVDDFCRHLADISAYWRERRHAVLGYIGSSDDLALLRRLETSPAGTAATIATISRRMIERRREARATRDADLQARRGRGVGNKE